MFVPFQFNVFFCIRNEPGDIDNSSLIEKIISNDCGQLKPGLRSGIHFEMIPELLWIFLRKYYRCSGPIVCRKVVYRKTVHIPELDLYPVSVRFLVKIYLFFIFIQKLIIKIFRNPILSPQQMQTMAANNNNNSQSTHFAYPLINFVTASMFGKISNI